MYSRSMENLLFRRPIVAALKDGKDVKTVCSLPVETVFLLSGGILGIAGAAQALREAKKRVFIHVDLVSGLRADKEGLRFIAQQVKPYGVISTKGQTIRQAKQLGLKAVFRVFMVDTIAFDTGLSGIAACAPDCVEVMPGVVYDGIRQLKREVGVPIIAGGMVKTPEQAREALQSGADAVSTSNHSLWKDDSF